MFNRIVGFFILFLFFFFSTYTSFAQFNHPELKWKVMETPHFLIHYHQGEESFAQNAAYVAEDLYERVAKTIGYHPTHKIPIVIENYQDTTGGYTSVFENKIVIQAQSEPTRTAGNLSWMREVIGHELVHYVSFAAIDESIFPIRKAMANLVIPMWFVEGLAQYLAEEWHPLKEMLVGERARRNVIMSEGDLGAFYFFDGWGRMAGYYQSDSFVRYIFETYGKDKISSIFDNLRAQPLIRVVGVISTTGEGALYPLPRFIDFDEALKKVLGKGIRGIYKEWREKVIEKYEKKEGDPLPDEKRLIEWGEKAAHPRFSPTGDKLAFVSDKRYDHIFYDLYLMDLSTGKVKKLVEGVGPFFSFSPDGKWIVYSKANFYSPERSVISDLYKVNVRTHRITRLTHGKRAFQPSFSPDGGRIVFVRKDGGNSNLYLLHLKTDKISPLTINTDGLTQNFSPSFSPDGKKIVFVRFIEGRRDVCVLDLKSEKVRFLTKDDADDRCPLFFPDGEKVMFVSDRGDDVFNLWSVDLRTGGLRRFTRVQTGVFDPDISGDGEKVVFSGYRKGRFSLYLFGLGEFEIINHTVGDKHIESSGEVSRKNFEGEKENTQEVIAEMSFGKKSDGESTQESFQPKIYGYRPELRLHYIFPWFSMSEEESYFSLDFFASDVLERHNLMGSTYLRGDNLQYNLLYTNRSFSPTLWVNFYRQEGWSTFQNEVFPVSIEGGEGGFQYPLNSNLTIGTNYSSREIDTSLFDASLNLLSWKGQVRTIGVWMQYTDLIPVREPGVMPWGNRFYLGAEWAGEEIESDLRYLMWNFDARDYWRISPKQTLAMRLLGKRVDNREVEPRLAFSLGGRGNLRGYKRDFLVGENLLFSSVEYRFNWWRRIGGSSFFYFDSFGGALFYDAGCTWREEENLEDAILREDVGLEFRMRMLPFGKYSLLMRMGMAWPIHYERTDGRFFILFGGVF